MPTCRLLCTVVLPVLSIACASSPAPTRTEPSFALLHAQTTKRLTVPTAVFTQALPTTKPVPVQSLWDGSEHVLLGGVIHDVCPDCPFLLPLGAELTVTAGELIALGGDYVDNVWQLQDLTLTESGRNQVLYDLVMIRQAVLSLQMNLVKTDADKRQLETFLKRWKQRESAIPEHDKLLAEMRIHQLDSTNFDHFLNTDDGDTQKAVLEKLAKGNTLQSNYHNHHRTALMEAFLAGKQKTPLANALISEAMGMHRLTDAFSAGHVRTPRRGAARYWNAREPGFFAKFKDYMADQIVSAINQDNWWSIFVTDSYLRSKSHESIEQMLNKNGIPDYDLGDLITMALHDFDGTKGVVVSVANPKDGEPTLEGQLVGDGDLFDNPRKDPMFTRQRVEAAITASVAELQAQYRAGAELDSHFKDPTQADGLYAAEKLLPVPAANDRQPTPAPVWKTVDWQALLTNKEMVEALKITLAGKKGTFDEIAGSMSDGYQKDALQKGVVKPLGDDPIGVVRTVLGRK